MGAPLPSVRQLPSQPGVYRFRDERGRILYIGRAVHLRRRVASYWGGLRERRHLRRMIPRIARVEAVWCDSHHEAAWLERNLLEHSRPPWNRTEGVESELYIAVHDTVQARHDPAADHGEVFGPYLGGEKVRLAVSALNRALPVAYVRQRLGGFDRDMARVRGLLPGSRPELIAQLCAVLRREPDAVARVRAALAERRDAAAAALAFELAARIHAELEALDWVLAENKVTGSGADLDIHGWADGVLVTFQLRDGRLRVWQQRSCGEAAARERVAATPQSWRAFADRNARLAASLAGNLSSSPLVL